jgi:hypothetical protein
MDIASLDPGGHTYKFETHHPVRLKERVDAIEDALTAQEETPESFVVPGASNLDLSSQTFFEYPWEIFERDGAFYVRNGVVSYAGGFITVSGMGTGDYEIPISPATSDTEYIAVYVIIDFDDDAENIATMAFVQDGTNEKLPEAGTDNTDNHPIGWLEVDTDGNVVDYDNHFTGGFIKYTRSDT